MKYVQVKDSDETIPRGDIAYIKEDSVKWDFGVTPAPRIIAVLKSGEKKIIASYPWKFLDQAWSSYMQRGILFELLKNWLKLPNDQGCLIFGVGKYDWNKKFFIIK
jgi:hypothetical protein